MQGQIGQALHRGKQRIMTMIAIDESLAARFNYTCDTRLETGPLHDMRFFRFTYRLFRLGIWSDDAYRMVWGRLMAASH
jgi:hypothetical protein